MEVFLQVLIWLVSLAFTAPVVTPVRRLHMGVV